jgi:MoaA/NifB/PqqE/SkfB family radical SAM enzyme
MGFTGFKCNITSNGMTISKMKEEQLENLKTCKTHINISIDSFNNEVQAKIRGNTSALEKAVDSVNKLQSSGIQVTQLTTISRFNYKDLCETVKKAYSLGIKEVLFQPVIHSSNYPDRKAIGRKNKINVPPERLEILNEQLDRILAFESDHPIKTNIYRIKPWINAYIRSAYSSNGGFFFESLLKKFHCREVSAVIDISYTGGIQPCGLALAENFIQKNPDNGLLDIWSESNRNLIKQLEVCKYPEICNSCCHKFGRNMMASVLKYPVANRKALWLVMGLLISRTYSRILKYNRASVS